MAVTNAIWSAFTWMPIHVSIKQAPEGSCQMTQSKFELVGCRADMRMRPASSIRIDRRWQAKAFFSRWIVVVSSADVFARAGGLQYASPSN